MQEYLLRQRIWQRIHAYEQRSLLRVAIFLFVLWWVVGLGFYNAAPPAPSYDLYAEIPITDIAEELTLQTFYANEY